MYNLLISGETNHAWNEEPWEIERERCIREFTDPAITKKYGSLTDDNINELKRYPCIFAYERCCNQEPQFGIIRNITLHGSMVIIEYGIIEVNPFITANDLENFAQELDISNSLELNRTHWSVKNTNLSVAIPKLAI